MSSPDMNVGWAVKLTSTASGLPWARVDARDGQLLVGHGAVAAVAVPAVDLDGRRADRDRHQLALGILDDFDEPVQHKIVDAAGCRCRVAGPETCWPG